MVKSQRVGKTAVDASGTWNCNVNYSLLSHGRVHNSKLITFFTLRDVKTEHQCKKTRNVQEAEASHKIDQKILLELPWTCKQRSKTRWDETPGPNIKGSLNLKDESQIKALN